ncbi:MAG: cytochrome c3 family protein [Candidatus Binatia bacterium]
MKIQSTASIGIIAILLSLLGATESSGQVTGIAATKHNLSLTGPGPIRATTQTQICLFCHTPHNANPLQPPLWNREFSSANYVPYTSPSLQASVGQPTSYSKLCLSCHDGTIAIGSVRNLGGSPTVVSGLEAPLPPGSTLIGTVLTNDHPISFVFDQALRSADQELADPSLLTGPIKLYPGANPGVADSVQCTSCHDPHEGRIGKFLRKSAMGQSDNLCLTCHVKPGWVGSTHESDTFFWPQNQTTTEVRDHSCFGCHTPHTVEAAERLLRNAAVGGASAIEETCYLCHKSSAAGGIAQDIQFEFTKTWRHPVDSYAGHKPVFISIPPTGLPEGVLLSPGQAAPDPSFVDSKHVECVDCHNPHRVLKTNRTEGMRGIDLNGNVVQNVINDPVPLDGTPSTTQYPICLRCHGDTFSTVVGIGTLPSGAQPSNKRIEFQTTNSAFHPVGGPGRNTSANLNDQLTPNGLSTSSVIKCTDCHNSNAYEATAGRVPSTGTASTPVGPHGSIYGSIRRARYENTLPGPSSWDPANFNLCFRCHDVTKLTARRFGEGGRTNFNDEDDPPNGKGKDNLHWFHLIKKVDKARALCKSCHYNIHSNQEAPNTQYNIDGFVTTTPPAGTPTRLVNFHPNIRPIGGRAKPEWEFNTTTKVRRCWLQCHKEDGSPGGPKMDGFAYRPPSGDLP